MSFVDTHQHLVDPALGRYSWRESIPALAERSFTYEDYLGASEGCGIVSSVFMETTPDNWAAEAGFIYRLADRPNTTIRGVVANAHPEDNDFDEYLEKIAHARLSGLRRICHVEADGFSDTPRFVANVRKLGPLGLTFDLCFLSRQLPWARRLIARCPDVQFILDHCGVPDITGNDFETWRDRLRDVASEPNVVCKLSGVLAYCAPGDATLESVRPYVLECIETFGPSRIMWGSDWPVVNIHSSLSTWVQISRRVLGELSAGDQRAVSHDNAVRIYKLAGSD